MPAPPFVVNIAVLRRSIGSRRDVHLRGPLPGLGITSSHVPSGGEVAVDVVLESLAGNALLATGTVESPWEGECRRCLKTARGELRAEVRELFEERADDEDIYPLRGDQVDLEPMARDAVLLELPLAPLCSEECAGLCPTCGADRNERDCGCEPDDTDPRWAALEQLRHDD